MNNKSNRIVNLVLFLYVLSILLDFHIFYNSTSTLIRCLIVTSFFSFAFFKYGKSKERKLLIAYFVMYFVFIVLHMVNINNNNILAELLYFYKMLSSVFIIYTVYKLKIDLTDFYKILNICILIICGSIVVCNFFKFGYSSYDYYHIKYNIFDWFSNNNSDFLVASSKGFFHFTNQIVAVIVLYLPIIINQLKVKTSFFNTFCLIIALLSLLMLGNRIASLMPLIILIISIMVYLMLLVIKKEICNYKFMTLLFVVMGAYVLILSKSPLLNRYDYYDSINSHAQINEKTVKKLIEETVTEEEYLDDKKRQEDIRALFDAKLVNINFPLYYYPYDDDPEFWNHMLKYDSNILYDSRFIEKSIVRRMVQLNNNKIFDSLFGIGYDRIMNVQNIEQDYVMQYYSIGIIGTIIIVGVYIMLYLYLLFKLGFNIDTKFTFSNLMLLLSLGSVLSSAYFSGNILNATSTIIPISFVMAIALNEINKKSNNYPGKILGFNVYNDSKSKLVKDILNSTEQNIIFNINPLIVTNFYKDENVVKTFNKQHYNIADGSGIILASKIKNGNIKKQITGIELVEDICSKSKQHKIYLYGSKEGVALKAKEQLEKKYKGIKIVGVSNGYINEKDAIKNILKAKPDILFVALGSPKQEDFIINNKLALKNIKIIMPVGGSLDVISGNTKRAPKFWSKMHLEWLYRMLKEPKRIKQNINLFKYLFLVVFKNEKYNKKSK